VTHRLLLIDDDVRLAAMVAEYLGASGWQVEARESAAAGLAAVRTGEYEAIVLDVMLPDGDGFDVLRTLRAAGDVPVLMLTARGDPMDRVVGLELGADDYLPKPFEPRELLARLRALVRRTQPGGRRGEVLRFGRLEIDRGARSVRVDAIDVQLTSYQFALLVALAEHAGRVMSRDQLLDLVKGEPLEAFDRSIDVHVSRIRAAIEDDPKRPRRIVTVRGAGYLFARTQDERR
jgi:DNA-binding response OmpR family regulator